MTEKINWRGNLAEWEANIDNRVKQLLSIFDADMTPAERIYALSFFCKLFGFKDIGGSKEMAAVVAEIRQNIDPENQMSSLATARLDGIKMTCLRMKEIYSSQELLRDEVQIERMRKIGRNLLDAETRISLMIRENVLGKDRQPLKSIALEDQS